MGDTKFGNFEESRLGIRCGFPVDLVAGKDYQIRSLAIEDRGDEGESPGISRTLVARRRGLGVAADAGPSGKMQVGDLEDLESAVFVDMESGPFIMHWEATADREERALVFAASVREEKGMLRDFPARASFDGIGAEKDVYGGDGGMTIRFAVLGGPFQPNASWARFPALGALMFLRVCGIKVRDPYVKNHKVFVGKFGFALALNVDEGVIDPAAREIEVFIHPVPLLGVELAAGEEVDSRAEGDRYVGYYEAMLVRRKCVVNSIWEDVEAVVEKEEEEED